MDWNCTFTEERLSDYLEGKLLPAEAAAFSAHTAGLRKLHRNGCARGWTCKPNAEDADGGRATSADRKNTGCHARSTHAEGILVSVARMDFGSLAAALRHGAGSGRGFRGYRFLRSRFDTSKIEESRPEPCERSSIRQPPSTPNVCSRRQIRERFEGGVRDSIQASARARAGANASR